MAVWQQPTGGEHTRRGGGRTQRAALAHPHDRRLNGAVRRHAQHATSSPPLPRHPPLPLPHTKTTRQKKLGISWKPPAGRECVDYFVVTVTELGPQPRTFRPDAGSQVGSYAITVKGLNPGATYSVSVQSASKANGGAGGAATTNIKMPNPTSCKKVVPGAVTAVTQYATSPTSLSYSWQAPANEACDLSYEINCA